LAQSIKIKLEDTGQIQLFSPEELYKLKTKPVVSDVDDDYNVDIRNLTEERVIRVIHDIYCVLDWV
jgi:hypothetical protein